MIKIKKVNIYISITASDLASELILSDSFNVSTSDYSFPDSYPRSGSSSASNSGSSSASNSGSESSSKDL